MEAYFDGVCHGFPGIKGLLQRIEHEVLSHRTAHSPAHDATGEHVMTKATYSPPCQVEAYVKSETHSWLAVLTNRTKKPTGRSFAMSLCGLLQNGGADKNLDWFYAVSPRLSRYSMGLREPRDILIRFSLYQRM